MASTVMGRLLNDRSVSRRFVPQVFPFAANFAEANRTHFELLAQAAEQAGFGAMALLVEAAGNQVTALPLERVIDELILAVAAGAVNSFGEDAGPEESEVADVPIVFAAGAAAGQMLGLQHHV